MNIDVLLFVIVLAAIEIIHFFERRDLYNRIMAKDLTDLHKDKGSHVSVENIIKKNMKNKILGG